MQIKLKMSGMVQGSHVFLKVSTNSNLHEFKFYTEKLLRLNWINNMCI